MQTLFKSNMSRAADKVLNGATEATPPRLEEMIQHWEPVLSHSSAPTEQHPALPEHRQKHKLAEPILTSEVGSINVPLNSAAGIDRITPAECRWCPVTVRALLYNMVLYIGSFPAAVLASRPVFVPKKANATLPGDFRPISIASVAVRQLHKILR